MGRLTAMRMMIVALVFAGSCGAQPLTWQDISGAAGFQFVAQAGSGSLFATNYRGVLYQSTDTGKTFGSILAYPSSVPVLELALNGDHAAARLRVALPGVTNQYQVLLWNGTPNDWTRILATSFSFIQALMLNDSGTVFGIDPFINDKLMRFNGSGWDPVGPRQSFFTAQFFNADLQVVTAVDHSNMIVVGSAAGGVHVSGDEGQTWQNQLPNYPITAIDVSIPGTMFVGASPSPSPPLNTFGGVFESSDSGRNWRGLGLPNHTISRLAVRSSGTVYALADGGAYRRDDGSGEWALISPAGRQFTSIVLPAPGAIFLSGEGTGTFRSTDDGATWAGSDIRGKDIFAIDTLPSGDLVAGTLGSGIFLAAGGGEGWTPLPEGSTGGYVYSFATGGSSFFAGTNLGVYRTTDGGRSWGNSTGGAWGGSAYAVATLAGGSVLAGTGFGLYRSSDGGDTWGASGLQSSTVYYLTLSGDGTVYAGTSSDGIFGSTDGGLTWSSRGLVRNDLQTVVANTAGDLFAGVYGGVMRSTDQGSTWQQANFTTGYVYSLVAPAPQTLYAGTYNGIYGSTDEGATWSAAGDSGLAQKVVLSLGMDSGHHLLAGTYRGTVYRSVRQVAAPVVSGVHSLPPLPASTELSQNYPNPFNPRTEIKFQIAGGPAYVNLRVFDLRGAEIAVLADGKRSSGTYTVAWDGANNPSGVYIYRLAVQPASPGTPYLTSRKMLLIR